MNLTLTNNAYSYSITTSYLNYLLNIPGSVYKEIFFVVFDVKEVFYTENINSLLMEYDGAEVFFEEQSVNVIKMKDGNGFIEAVNSKIGVFGIIKAKDFLFPQYIDRYMGLVPGLLQISSVSLENLNYVESIEQQKQHLEYLTTQDALTKLYNRAYFEETIEKMRDLDNWAVFICDLDGIKQINDNYGHEAGDEAFRLTAESLHQSFRESDVIYKFDEDKTRIDDYIEAYEKVAAAAIRVEWLNWSDTTQSPKGRHFGTGAVSASLLAKANIYNQATFNLINTYQGQVGSNSDNNFKYSYIYSGKGAELEKIKESMNKNTPHNY